MKGVAGATQRMSYLVIVESPAKANAIKGYLGSNYKVIASKGHVRDLPKSSLGIDVENGFKPLPDWKDALSRYLKEIEE